MTLHLNLNSDEERLVKNYEKLHSVSASEVAKQSLLEKIEDEYDLACAENGHAKFIADGKKGYSFEEVMKLLDL